MPNFALPDWSPGWVGSKFLIGCDLDLLLTEYYKETLESQLRNRDAQNEPVLSLLTVLDWRYRPIEDPTRSPQRRGQPLTPISHHSLFLYLYYPNLYPRPFFFPDLLPPPSYYTVPLVPVINRYPLKVLTTQRLAQPWVSKWLTWIRRIWKIPLQRRKVLDCLGEVYQLLYLLTLILSCRIPERQELGFSKAWM